jgi:hypothetical protein
MEAANGEKMPHPEERPLGRVSKDGNLVVSWFETREGALVTIRGLF